MAQQKLPRPGWCRESFVLTNDERVLFLYIFGQGHKMLRKQDLLCPGELCRREWTDLRWINPHCSGPDSDMEQLETRLAALHRDFPETCCCSIEDVCNFLRAARRPAQRFIATTMNAPASQLPLAGHLAARTPCSSSSRRSATPPGTCAVGADTGPYGTLQNPYVGADSERASLLRLTGMIEALHGVGCDRLPCLPPLIPPVTDDGGGGWLQPLISSVRAATEPGLGGPGFAPNQRVLQGAALTAPWLGAGPCEPVRELLWSQALAANYSSLLCALASGAAPPVASPHALAADLERPQPAAATAPTLPPLRLAIMM